MNIVYWFVHHLKYDVPLYFLKIVYMFLATGGHYCPMGKTKKALWSMMSSLGSDTQTAVTWCAGGGEGLCEPLVRVWDSGYWVGKACFHNTFLTIADVSLSMDHTSNTSIFSKCGINPVYWPSFLYHKIILLCTHTNVVALCLAWEGGVCKSFCMSIVREYLKSQFLYS